PEARSVRESLIHCLAGDSIMEDIRKDIIRRGLFRSDVLTLEFTDLYFARLNTQFGAGLEPNAATGLHENYLTERRFYLHEPNTVHPAFCEFFAPFLATRQVFDGAGAVRNTSDGWKYLLSQRASFVKSVGNAGTMGSERGLIHFRPDVGESPADKIRLHLHCGDMHMSPFGKFIAIGATHLLLRAFEEEHASAWPFSVPDEKPVAA
ncbi:MAG: proteasome accessory factor PafA2 family protein, partial [Candidatus Sungbacteria bacterium]|nr:proteasome accessory factor PafA2 family protein [Candidatus Sungbacteria bacterium]